MIPFNSFFCVHFVVVFSSLVALYRQTERFSSGVKSTDSSELIVPVQPTDRLCFVREHLSKNRETKAGEVSLGVMLIRSSSAFTH
jgi:hypothetical protein